MEQITGTVSVLEVIWFVTGAIPALWDARLVWRLFLARKKLKDDGKNGADEIEIVTHIGRNVLILIGHLLIVMIGVAAMCIPPATNAPPISPTGVIVTLGLMGMSFVFTLKTLWNNWRWRVSMNYNAQKLREAQRIGGAIPS